MNFNQTLNNYLSELHQEVLASQSGETTAELSFRTSLDNFFKNIAREIDSKIVTIPEPKNQNKLGRPDWRFHNEDSMGVYGYVEAKGFDSQNEINKETYRKQVEKYLTLGNPVLLTDGIDFILFKPNGEEVHYSACQKPINWNNLAPNSELETLFLTFFGQIGHRTISENQLVKEVAKRAKLLTSEIHEFLDLEEDETENQIELNTVRLLRELKETAALNHDKNLGEASNFSSFISQVLTFGLLYAHRIINSDLETPKIKYDRIHEFWFSALDEKYTNKLIPFKTLVKGLETELNSVLSRLGLWYDDLRRLLAHIKLSENQVEAPDFHQLYEMFLSKYDPETRFDYGAFYTPRFLAFYTVRFAKKLIETSMHNIDINTIGNKIIDPCCGTGTFIEAILNVIIPNDKVELIGFEILPAPYALAHYRMSIINDVYPENIQIKLTNTLSDTLFELDHEPNSQDSNDLSKILVKEQEEAYNLATPPLTLIIGNPPSSDSISQVQNEGEIIKALIDNFRPDANNRTSRQNTQKQLKNEFVKFLRWTTDKTLKSTPSIFVLILPSSFSKHPSYKFARKYLIEKFNEIWVLDFDSDLRTGTRDINLFDTQQGRLILAATFKEENSLPALINYNSITHLSKVDKFDFLNRVEINLDDWEEIELDQDDYSLKPKMEFNKEEYSLFWPLTDSNNEGIFLRHCSGLKLAPTHLLVHASSGQLKRRSKFISKSENDFEAIKSKWYNGQRKIPSKSKITDGIKSKLGLAANTNNITSYSYRPFLETSVILNDDLLTELQQLGGGGTRDRPEVRAAYSDERVFGFIVSPAPQDLGDNLHKFSSFCWKLPDNDLSKRGNARVFCNFFPEYKTRLGEWNSVNQNNVNPDLVSLLSDEFDLPQDEVITRLTFYCYALLSSNLYLTSFKGALFCVAGNWPKIPITKDKLLFVSVSEFGKTLANIEKSDYIIPDVAIGEIALLYHNYSFEEHAIILKDDSGEIVKQYTDIASDVINFEISGYNVLKEWLKMHSFQYYRKALEVEKLLELETLIFKISLYIEKIEELDLEVEQILCNELFSQQL